MTKIALIGDLLIAFSPVIAVFALVVTRDDRLTILSIGGAFSWMLSVLVSSIWWYIIGPMQTAAWFTVLWAVIFQELIRCGFCYLVFWVEKRLNGTAPGRKELPNHVLIGLAVGVGMGFVYVLVNVVPVLLEGRGAAAAFSPGCPSVSLFTMSAVHALLLSVLHMVLSVMAFFAYELRRWYLIVILWSLLNSPSGHCAGSLCAILAVVLADLLVVYITMRVRNPFVGTKNL